MPRVLLAGCAALPRGDGDEDVLIPALAEAGCETGWIVWDDPHNGAAEADLVVLRATWDYAPRREEFLRWCESVPALRNGPHVVRWNTDKTYLMDLAAAGVAIVPTEVVEAGARPEWPGTEFVVKPTVGAGSRGAARFAADDLDRAGEHLAGLHRDGFSALVQPYQPTVDTHGETAVVFVAGRYSHAFIKGPMLGGSGMDESGLFVEEDVRGTDPEPEVISFADEAVEAACGILGISRAELLYARVDVVRDADGKPAVLELELSEPSLGLQLADASATAGFAAAIRDVIDQRAA